MNITFKQLREIKHQLPTGSIARIASDLQLEEQTVRNFFGAKKYNDGDISSWHLQPGPNGGIMSIKDTTILDHARAILDETQQAKQRQADES